MVKKKGKHELTEELIENSVEDIAKCYMLLKYAYNTEEENKKYKKEFEKRYNNFYLIINNLEKDIDNNHYSDIGEEIKKMFNLDFYKSNMSFLDCDSINEIKEKDESVDIDYEKKASMIIVKLNFYHGNNYEFGNNTRLHVDINNYGLIDLKPFSEEESFNIFSSLTDYYLVNIKNKKIKVLKDM